jgi:hypothetical protein
MPERATRNAIKRNRTPKYPRHHEDEQVENASLGGKDAPPTSAGSPNNALETRLNVILGMD